LTVVVPFLSTVIYAIYYYYFFPSRLAKYEKLIFWLVSKFKLDSFYLDYTGNVERKGF
jgi:hypothetical protein